MCSEGLQNRSITKGTEDGYKSKIHRLQELIIQNQHLFPDDESAIKRGPDGKFEVLEEHLLQWDLPLSVANAKRLFTIISVSEGLVKKRKGADLRTNVFDDDNAVHVANPGAQIPTVTSGTMNNYKSALKWFHRWENTTIGKRKVAWNEEVDEALAGMLQSYKRDVGTKRMEGVMKPREGKDPFSREGFEALAKFMYGLQPDGNYNTWSEILFMNLYCRLQMQSIGRSNTVSSLLFSHFNWEEDAFMVLFVTSKGDQDASRLSNWKRMYANPDMPHTCIFLALALYIWCRTPENPGTQGRLFDGEGQKDRYLKNLMKFIGILSDAGTDLGAPAADLGTHSIRKFSDTYAKNVSNGPTEDNVKIRAGHTTGKTNDSYHKADQESDAFVGRVLTLRPLTDAKFASLCPHFDTAANDRLREVGLGGILPNYEKYDANFKRILPFLLATLLFHHKNGNLEKLLSPAHPIFVTTLFTSNPMLRGYLEDHILLGINECPDTHMRAQGVPPTVVMYIQQQEMERTIASNTTAIDAITSAVASLAQTIQSELEIVRTEGPQKTAEYLNQHFVINGVPITMNSLELVLRARFDEQDSKTQAAMKTMLTEVQGIAAASRAGNSSLSSTAASSRSISQGQQIHEMTASGGLLYGVPVGYEYPSYGVRLHWNLWHLGNPEKNICPHKFLSDSKRDLPPLGNKHADANNRRKLSTARAVCSELVRICMESYPFLDNEPKNITMSNLDTTFDHAWGIFLPTLYPEGLRNPRAYSDLNVNTAYNRWTKYRR